MLVEADVQDDASMDKHFRDLEKRMGGSWILSSMPSPIRTKASWQGDSVKTSRANFKSSLDISCYSLIDVARRARPLMKNGGTILTLTYQGSNRIIPYYNVMGVAKAALESAMPLSGE